MHFAGPQIHYICRLHSPCGKKRHFRKKESTLFLNRSRWTTIDAIFLPWRWTAIGAIFLPWRWRAIGAIFLPIVVGHNRRYFSADTGRQQSPLFSADNGGQRWTTIDAISCRKRWTTIAATFLTKKNGIYSSLYLSCNVSYREFDLW